MDQSLHASCSSSVPNHLTTDTACLGKYLEHPDFPQGLCAFLHHFETKRRQSDPVFDITQEAPKKWAIILDRVLHAHLAAQRASEAQKIQEAQHAEVNSDQAHLKEGLLQEQAYAALLNCDEYLRAPNTGKITIMLTHPHVPPSEWEKWRAFVKLMTLAQADERDAQIIFSKINQLNLHSRLPDPMGFIQSLMQPPSDRARPWASRSSEYCASKPTSSASKACAINIAQNIRLWITNPFAWMGKNSIAF